MQLELAESWEAAQGVMSFKFKVEQWMNFLPGQYAIMRLDAPGDLRNGIRDFSISSSPTEKGHLIFTTKISESPFKKKLASMKPGESADIAWPYGNFTLQKDYSRPALMLTGGIGITPMRSMVKYSTDLGLPLKITMLYSCRVPEEMVYYEEMEELGRKNPNFEFVATITRPEESKTEWDGKVGRIDENLVRQFLLPDSVVYTCGPPAMVDAMKTLSDSMGIAKKDLRTEKFTGY